MQCVICRCRRSGFISISSYKFIYALRQFGIVLCAHKVFLSAGQLEESIKTTIIISQRRMVCRVRNIVPSQTASFRTTVRWRMRKLFLLQFFLQLNSNNLMVCLGSNFYCHRFALWLSISHSVSTAHHSQFELTSSASTSNRRHNSTKKDSQICENDALRISEPISRNL